MTEANTPDHNDEKPTVKGPNWDDPAVAVGNAPPMSSWPLAISLLAWAGGIVFLVAMAMDRLG